MSPTPPDDTRKRGPFWSGARTAGAVPIRFFDVRFGYVHEHLARLENRLLGVERAAAGGVQDAPAGIVRADDAVLEAVLASQAQVGRLLVDLQREVRAVSDALGELQTEDRDEEDRRERTEALRHAGPAPASVEDLTPAQRSAVNRSNSHDGYASQVGLWFNPPLSVGYSERGVELNDVNERIAEVPFVLTGLAHVPRGGRVLDIGARESLLSFQLASLGYRATALDPRGYPLQHPELDVISTGVEELPDDARYDAIVCLSTIEHLGLGSYGLADQPDGDLRGMAAMRRALTPGGVLLLTTPFGAEAKVDDLERTYDRDGLQRLLGGFEVLELSYLVQRSPLAWERTDEPSADPAVKQVALVVARGGAA